MSDFDEFNKVNGAKLKSLNHRENYYEQKRKLHTVWNLNYAPSSDASKDSLQLTGTQVQLAFDMGYRLAMTQVRQCIEKSRVQLERQNADKAFKKIARFTEERIEDSFCLHYFEGLYDELLKHKKAYELDADRNWIDCPEYE